MRPADACFDGSGCQCPAGDKAILPFLRDPPISSYNYPAFLLGAVLGSDPSGLNFLFNNYIQLSFRSIYSAKHLISFLPVLGVDDLGALGMGEVRMVKPASAEEAARIIPEALADGFYVRLVLDEFYIPERPAFRRLNFQHDNLVHGFCRSCQSCHLVGYRHLGQPAARLAGLSRFDASTCPLPALVSGIFSQPKGSAPILHSGAMLLFRPGGPARGLDIPFVRRQLSAYLASRHDPKIYGEKGYPRHSVEPWPGATHEIRYGLAAYEDIAEYTRKTLEKDLPLDLRPYRIIWEHKSIMARRLRTLAPLAANASGGATDRRLALLTQLGQEIRVAAVAYLNGLRKTAGLKVLELLPRLRRVEQDLILDYLNRS